MADASNLQTGFLGGEWSPSAQGRADEKDYRIAMTVCANGFPLEVGAWTRRPGTRFAATTRLGQKAWLLPFAFAQNSPYTMEFTNQFLRLFSGFSLVSTPDPQTVISVSSANPAVITTQTAHGWSSGQNVQFLFSNSQSYPGAAPLMNRQLTITVTGSTTFTIADPITGLGIDGSTITLPPRVAQVVRINEIASPYTSSQLTNINRIQAEGTVVTLAPTVAPWSLTQLTAPSAAAYATFSYAKSVFSDGPYMDPAKTGTLTPSGTSGSITLSGAPSNTFASTDVNRLIRLYSEPPLWAAGTGYTTGQSVKYNNLYYTALANSTGKAPDQFPIQWAVNVAAAVWSWGVITAVGSDTSVTFTINGTPLLYTNSIVTWRLGLYSDTTGYPTCGIYHEGRLWLAGAQGNRFDASNSNDVFNFAPTQPDGTVTDANGISYVFNAEDVNEIFWMMPDNNGIVCGTQGGEWMVAASQLNDPLTPTSIQAHRRSKYKSANAQAVHAGMSLLFIQAQARKVMEYVADVFSGKFLGRNLNEKTRHLTTNSLVQISYQQEKNPTLWGRDAAGQLIGTTYKRESSFASEPPTMNGWHRHTLGSGRVTESLSVGPSVGGDLESLSMVTNDPTTNIRHVEIMTDVFDETSDLEDAWFLDDAVTPTAAVENSTKTSVSFYGMSYLAGKTVQVWAGGLDLGDYVVGADGSVVVPINSTSTTFPGVNFFTDTYLSQLEASGETFNGFSVPLNQSVTVRYPVGSGLTIQSYVASPLPNDGFFYMDDFKNGEVYGMWPGRTAGNTGIAVFDRFTGVQKRIVTGDVLFPTGTEDVESPMFLGGDGFLYFISDQGNTGILNKVNTQTLRIAGRFGVGGGITNNNTQIVHIGSAVALSIFGRHYLVHAGSAFPYLGVMDLDAMQYAGSNIQYTEGGSGQVCRGEIIDGVHGGYGVAYSISAAAGPTTVPIGLYRTVITAGALSYDNPPSTTGAAAGVTNTGISSGRIAQIAPSAVDPTWTHFVSVVGLAYDQTDGNLLAFANTLDPVTHQAYAFKINSTTGAVIWATPVSAIPSNGLGMNQSIIKYSLYSYISTTIITINTASGAVTTTAISNLAANNVCISNDIDGSIITEGSWNGTSPPTGVGGTVGFSGNQVYRLMGTAAFPGQVTYTQSGAVPVVIGFTYTSQGQVIRPLAPDATGARNGPALGKHRRVHRYAMLCANVQGLHVGTDFTKLNIALFTTPGGTAMNVTQLKTGTHSQTLTDRESYDGMVAWQITRPYPATVAAVEAFMHTEDR